MWALNNAGTVHEFAPVNVASVQIDGRTYRVADTPNPQSDGVSLGVDHADPGDIRLTLLLTFQHIRNVTMQREMLTEASAAFLQAWDAPEVRSQVGEVSDLVVPTLGVFEGRPRRAEWDWSTYGLGYLIGKATFVRSTLVTYLFDESGQAEWRTADVQIAPPEPRDGWEWPLEWPLLTYNPTVKSTWFEVAGTAPAHVVLSLTGPLQAGAEVEVPGCFRGRLNQGLAHDQTAEFDARPGRMVQTINGAPALFLTPTSTPPSGFILPPGPHQLSLRGISSDGQARASVRWRDTKAGI